MSNQPVHIFTSYLHLKKHVGHLPTWLAKLIQTLGHSPIQYILPKYENSQIVSHFTGYIPNSNILKQTLEELKSPLVAFYSHQVISQDKSPTIVSNNGDNNLIIHEIEDLKDKILPTLIDCTNPNKIIIKRPGQISKSDLETLTANKIEITKDYFTDLNLGQVDIFNVKIIPLKETKTVIIGTKEKLKNSFSLGDIKHFHILEIDNYILINLGSITSPENIVTQLSKNISLAKNFGLPYIYFLQTNWPKNNWGEILGFIFNNLTRELPQNNIKNQVENLNYLQNLKSFADSLV
jgi:hypothetical protein